MSKTNTSIIVLNMSNIFFF